MNSKKRLKRFWSSGLLYDLTTDTERTHTRKINPKLGLLGFAGLLGFLGFSQSVLGPDAFLFFAFFGFFGFYYEGKMSNTLIDERFTMNAYRARSIASQIGLLLIIIPTIVVPSRMENMESVVGFLIGLIGLSFGLVGFLQQYLLYRFENEE